MPKIAYKDFSRRLTVRMPEDLYDDLRRCSDVDDFHTLNDCIVAVLRCYVEDRSSDLSRS